jgi:hypothetical protein
MFSVDSDALDHPQVHLGRFWVWISGAAAATLRLPHGTSLRAICCRGDDVRLARASFKAEGALSSTTRPLAGG